MVELKEWHLTCLQTATAHMAAEVGILTVEVGMEEQQAHHLNLNQSLTMTHATVVGDLIMEEEGAA